MIIAIYIVVKGIISVIGSNDNNRRIKKLICKNNTLFRPCKSKIHITFTENAEDIDIVMPMYNLLEYSDHYSDHHFYDIRKFVKLL